MAAERESGRPDMDDNGYNAIGVLEIREWLGSIEQSLVACYLRSVHPRFTNPEHSDETRRAYFMNELDGMRDRIARYIALTPETR
jgi:hypothetical protein